MIRKPHITKRFGRWRIKRQGNRSILNIDAHVWCHTQNEKEFR